MNVAIIPAGGSGSRIGAGLPKQFVLVHDKPIIAYTLEKFNNHKSIDKIVVGTHPHYIEETQKIIREYNISKADTVIEGGATRQETVYKCLLASQGDIALVHDAARPLVTDKIIHECIRLCPSCAASLSCDTVLEGDGAMITGKFDRTRCFLAQTPQCFPYGELLEAHKKASQNGIEVTDDCSLLLEKGIHIVQGDTLNFKITTPQDLALFMLLTSSSQTPHCTI
ncbi:2-C-methyl-D-erythritol 4-phosphate cytidylyltransferase [Clostridia bacterium]|nr:2-C-methyl-D-erythritol 4-phosphate cytidylyltransferase [Clostridia bacterium]